ncbi:MAG: threonine--tRNA ligase [Patescibacteria group bacterium]
MDIATMRHSTAHLLAAAILKLYPATKFGVGPVVENGFYYDIDLPVRIGPQELKKIEEVMHAIAKERIIYERQDVTLHEAKTLFNALKQPYKVELLNDLEIHSTTVAAEIYGNQLDEREHVNQEVNTVSVYKTGDFIDLCRGPHVATTKDLGVFTLTTVAGAYWRGKEDNPQMQRVYGVAFPTQAELDTYLALRAEAESRDHRKLGSDLDLFVFSDLVGAGLPLFTPRGTIIRDELERFVQSLQMPYGYQRVCIPHITKKELYETSGHWQKFQNELFRITTREGHEFAMKPMNCPHHTQIYASRIRSYRELPIRYSEVTMVYRDEQSGELSGLSRVRMITQDDAHVFCRMAQVEKEVMAVWDIVDSFYKPFHMPLKVRFSRYDPKRFDRYLGTKQIWNKAEAQLRSLIEKRGARDVIDGLGEAAMYGPKIDFIAQDSLGRQWQLATIQLDFNMPERFNLTCVNEKGEDERIVMIHRAILGSFERFLAILIEHFAGAFPAWLAPVQVVILPVRTSNNRLASQFAEELKGHGIRVMVDDTNTTIGNKVRKAMTDKIPYQLVFGDKEASSSELMIRKYGVEKPYAKSKEEFIKELKEAIQNKT